MFISFIETRFVNYFKYVIHLRTNTNNIYTYSICEHKCILPCVFINKIDEY